MHLVVNLQRMFLPSELASVIMEELDNGGKPFHQRSIIVDRSLRDPFNIRAILSTPPAGETYAAIAEQGTQSRNPKIGTQTYTIFNLRRDIIELSLFDKLPSQNNKMSQDILWEEKSDGTPWNCEFDGDKVKAAMKLIPSENEIEKNQALVFERTLMDFLGAIIINNYAGMLRALGFSTMTEAPSATESISTAEEQGQYWSSTLAFAHLPIICRSHPIPMSNRSMDLLALLILADANWRDVIKENRRSITVAEDLRGHIAINRPYFTLAKGVFRVDEKSKVTSLIEENVFGSFVSNCRLARYTGRYGYLRGFPIHRESKGEKTTKLSTAENPAPSDDDSDGGHKHPFGIVDYDDELEVEQFLQYTSNVTKGSSSVKKDSTRPLFSQQHFGEIPGTMKGSFQDFKIAFEEGIQPIGKIITELLYSEDSSGSLNHKPTRMAEVHQNQKIFLEVLQQSCLGDDKKAGCDPGRSTTAKDWKFLCQQEYIDITSCVEISALEPTSVRMKYEHGSSNTSEHFVAVQFNEDIPPVDANIDAFNHSLLVLGHGSKQTLAFLQSLMPKENGKLTPYMLFRESLAALRNLTHEQLALLGLGKADNPLDAEQVKPILYDLVTGRVFSILLFEHYMCKYFLLLRHLFPHSTMVQDPNPDSHFCHPEHPSNAILSDQLPILYTLFSKCVNSFSGAALSNVDQDHSGAFFRCSEQPDGSFTFALPRLICYPNEDRVRTIPTNRVVHDISANYRAIQKTAQGIYEKKKTKK